jgi:hypothetical protein
MVAAAGLVAAYLFGKPESITGSSRELKGEPAVLGTVAVTR